jgi:hypothetical protein
MMNIRIIQKLFDYFSISTKLVIASKLNGVSGKRDDLLLAICKKLGAEKYLSGISGKDYLDIKKFEQAGIKVTFQEFYHPIYRQCYQPFMPCMSSIDLLFNYGEKSKDILLSPGIPRLNYLIE